MYKGKVIMKKLSNEEKTLISWVPNKLWFSLKECCEMKGVNIKTLYNHPELQPNGSLGCFIGGRKQFRRDEVIQWLFKTDETLIYGRHRR